jgi:hypothetical protein
MAPSSCATSACTVCAVRAAGELTIEVDRRLHPHEKGAHARGVALAAFGQRAVVVVGVEFGTIGFGVSPDGDVFHGGSFGQHSDLNGLGQARRRKAKDANRRTVITDQQRLMFLFLKRRNDCCPLSYHDRACDCRSTSTISVGITK